jgi:very-short-patch-repair endonuclease
MTYWLESMRYTVEQEKRHQATKAGLRVSPEEDKLAVALAERGYNFWRQVKVELGPLAAEAQTPHYRLDFLVEDTLIVEVDSYTHTVERADWDRRRDSILGRMGYRTLRLSNEEVFSDIDGCLRKIAIALSFGGVV